MAFFSWEIALVSARKFKLESREKGTSNAKSALTSHNPTLFVHCTNRHHLIGIFRIFRWDTLTRTSQISGKNRIWPGMRDHSVLIVIIITFISIVFENLFKRIGHRSGSFASFVAGPMR